MGTEYNFMIGKFISVFGRLPNDGGEFARFCLDYVQSGKNK